MTPKDLLNRLEIEGIRVSAKLRVEGIAPPSPESLKLLEQNRDDLLAYLTGAYGNKPQMCRLSETLVEGSIWCSRCYRYHTNPCTPSAKRFKASAEPMPGFSESFHEH